MYTMGPDVFSSSYHVEVVRSPLTRSLVARFPDVNDEIRSAFEEYVPQTEGQKRAFSLGCGLILVSRLD